MSEATSLTSNQETAANDTNVRRQLADEIKRCEDILADQAWHPDIRHHAELRRSVAVPALAEIERLTRELASERVNIESLRTEKSNLASRLRMIDEGSLGKPTGLCPGTTRGNLGENSPAQRSFSGDSGSPVETSGELEQLRRIDRAARAFVNAVPESMTFKAGQDAFNALCDALFDGRPAENGSGDSNG